MVPLSVSLSQAQFPGDLARARRLMLMCGFILIALGMAWCGMYAFYGKWAMTALTSEAVVLGACVLALIFAGRVRLSAITAGHALLVLLVLLCLFDNPIAGVPRSTHMYFLPVAAGAILVFRKEGWYLRFVLPSLLLLACAICGASKLNFAGRGVMPPAEVHGIAAWVNYLSALGVLAVVFFIMQTNFSARRAWETDLREAIVKGQFQLAYQPQVDRNGRPYGAEVLLRWDHRRYGNVSPEEFIPFAEKTGVIVPMGGWVLRQACAQLARWAANPATAALTLSVNVSTSQFLQRDFVKSVIEILESSGAPASRLKLELTESVFNCDLEGSVRKMNMLRERGVHWSLDDFGTGYSSLSVVRKLPVDELKIDRSFVREVAYNASDRAIIRTLVSLSRSLGLFLVAEGVSEERQFSVLRGAGCDAFQGYLFGKPVFIEEFEAIFLSETLL